MSRPQRILVDSASDCRAIAAPVAPADSDAVQVRPPKTYVAHSRATWQRLGLRRQSKDSCNLPVRQAEVRVRGRRTGSAPGQTRIPTWCWRQMPVRRTPWNRQTVGSHGRGSCTACRWIDGRVHAEVPLQWLAGPWAQCSAPFRIAEPPVGGNKIGVPFHARTSLPTPAVVSQRPRRGHAALRLCDVGRGEPETR